jgi:dihydrofolate reductase
MRKLILQEFVSLDGRASGPKNSVDFVPAATKGDQRFGQEQLALMDTIDTILLGRVTYSMFADYWPKAKGDEKEFADKMGATPKVVFSRTIDRAPWGAWPECQISRSEPADEVVKLKRAPGKDIVMWGSLSVAQSLMDAGLIDEYRLIVCPVVLGDGRPLFADALPLSMTLLSATTLDRGGVYLRYRGGDSAAAGPADRREAHVNAE